MLPPEDLIHKGDLAPSMASYQVMRIMIPVNKIPASMVAHLATPSVDITKELTVTMVSHQVMHSMIPVDEFPASMVAPLATPSMNTTGEFTTFPRGRN